LGAGAGAVVGAVAGWAPVGFDAVGGAGVAAAGGLGGSAASAVEAGRSQSASPMAKTMTEMRKGCGTSEQIIVGVLITENALKREVTIRPVKNWNADFALATKLRRLGIV
jgi:hypothetical protein